MNTNLELYKLFYYVAKELSFSKASKMLYISQSAVSQGISLLESQLGTKLFLRTTKKVKLTEEGTTLMSHIEPAINSIMQGEKKLLEISNLHRGRLHIGVSDTLCKYYLLPYLKDFHEQYPNIEILITNRTSMECVDLLHNHMVDMIITNLPNPRLHESMDIIETGVFKDIIIAPTKFTSLGSKHVSLSEIVKYPILLLDQQSSTTQFLKEAFRNENLELHPAIELGSIDLLVEMASIGLGLTFIPDYVYRPHPDLQVVSLEHPLQQRKLGIAYLAKTTLSMATQAFISIMLTEQTKKDEKEPAYTNY